MHKALGIYVASSNGISLSWRRTPNRSSAGHTRSPTSFNFLKIALSSSFSGSSPGATRSQGTTVCLALIIRFEFGKPSDENRSDISPTTRLPPMQGPIAKNQAFAVAVTRPFGKAQKVPPPTPPYAVMPPASTNPFQGSIAWRKESTVSTATKRGLWRRAREISTPI